MNKAFIFFISFLFLDINTQAQLPAPTTQWSKCYGGTNIDGMGRAIEAHGGGFIVVGVSLSKDGNLDTCACINKVSFLAKVNIDGGIEWQKFYGNSEAGIGGIAKIPSGGYVLCGYAAKIGEDVTQIKGGGDYWVVRINDTGKIIWEKCYGGSEGDIPIKVLVDKSNNIYVGGYSNSYNGDVKTPHTVLPFATDDYWVIKLDSVGNLIWERSYGGSADDMPYDMALTADNGLVLCGRVESNNGDVVGFHRGFPVDAWVVKIDSNSNIEWQKPCGGSSSEDFYSITATEDSGFVVVGNTVSIDGDLKGINLSTDNSYKTWIIKFKKDGIIEWQKCIGGSGYSRPNIVVTDKQGNYIIQAEASVPMQFNPGPLQIDYPNKFRGILLKLDKHGELIWNRYVGGTNNNYLSMNAFASIILDHKNCIYGFGATRAKNYDVSNSNDDDSFLVGDGWIMKFNPEIEPIKISTNNSLTIYPNPAKDAAYIATKNLKEIRLIDALGRVYFNKKIDNTNNTGFTYIPLNYIANALIGHRQ